VLGFHHISNYLLSAIIANAFSPECKLNPTLTSQNILAQKEQLFNFVVDRLAAESENLQGLVVEVL